MQPAKQQLQLSFNDANHLYTIYDGTKYYLRQDTDLTLTVSTMPSTTWTKDGNDLYCTNSGTNTFNLFR